MNDQLLCGLALAAVGVAAIALGVHWLAAGAFVAAIPFLAVGSLLALATHRSLEDDAAGDELITS